MRELHYVMAYNYFKHVNTNRSKHLVRKHDPTPRLICSLYAAAYICFPVSSRNVRLIRVPPLHGSFAGSNIILWSAATYCLEIP